MERMRQETREAGAKKAYAAPKVLATYSKEDVARTVRPHGFDGRLSP